MKPHREYLIGLCSGLCLAALGAAQDPAVPKSAPAKPMESGYSKSANTLKLLSLQAFLGESVHARLDKASTPASTAEASSGGSPQVLAIIKDALVGKGGTLQTILVTTSVANASGKTDVVCEMPTKDLAWNSMRGVFETGLDAAGLAALPKHDSPSGAQPASEVSAKTMPDELLASKLLQASVRASDQAAGQSLGRVAKIWLHPGGLQLAFLAVPSDGLRLLPWTLARIDTTAGSAAVSLVATQKELSTAPTVEAATLTPDSKLRAKSYKHFKLPVPTWDNEASQQHAKDADR